MLFLEQNGQSNSLYWAIFQQLKRKKMQFKLSQGEELLAVTIQACPNSAWSPRPTLLIPTYQERARPCGLYAAVIEQTESGRYGSEGRIWLCTHSSDNENDIFIQTGGSAKVVVYSKWGLQTKYMTDCQPLGTPRTCRSNRSLSLNLQSKLEYAASCCMKKISCLQKRA